MSDPNLTPVEPGATAGDSALLTTLEGNVGDVVGALPDLSDDDLAQAENLERQGKNRSTVLQAISREREHRGAAGGDGPEPPVPSVTGNATDYRDRAATDVDPAAITTPVLTRDGWVVPSPKAEAKD